MACSFLYSQPHYGPEVDGVEGGADQGDEATENESGAQVPGHGSSRATRILRVPGTLLIFF